MTPGDWVTVTGGQIDRRMLVVRVDGRRVLCSWRWADAIKCDWFALSGLRLVELGPRHGAGE